MKRKLTLWVSIGLALVMAGLFSAGLVEAKWARSSNIGPAVEIIRLCQDEARIGLLISDNDPDTSPGTWRIKLTTDQELTRQPIELQPGSQAIPEPFPSDRETHIYNYVKISLPGIEAGTPVAITPIDPDGQEWSGFSPSPITQCNDRDDFNRQGPKLGDNWQGRKSPGHYRIKNGQVEALAGGSIYWKSALGVEQEAQVRLVKIDPHGRHRLLLKVQPNKKGNPNWKRGAMAIFYDAKHRQVGIETYRPETGRQTVTTFAYTMHDGDQLAGRIIDNGTAFVFVNDELIGVAVITDSFFVEAEGSVGLWFDSPKKPRAVFDDFKAVGND